MPITPDHDSPSPRHSGGVVTRAQSDPQNDTAQPPLTSGFGAILEKEHELQGATEGSFARVSGPRASEVDRLLRHQHARLGANIALLEERYEALPNPERFVSWQDRRCSLVTPPGEESHLLPDLIARHTRLLKDIDALLGCAPDGQRGELILTEVRRGHEEMASILTALLADSGTIMPQQ